MQGSVGRVVPKVTFEAELVEGVSYQLLRMDEAVPIWHFSLRAKSL